MSGLVLPNQSPQILVYWTRNLMEGGRLWTSQKMGHMENVEDLYGETPSVLRPRARFQLSLPRKPESTRPR